VHESVLYTFSDRDALLPWSCMFSTTRFAGFTDFALQSCSRKFLSEPISPIAC